MTTNLSPILKWAGGKEKELKYILPNIPDCIKRYFEPFVGGGAVYFSINAQNSYINDKSYELITLYQLIKDSNRDFFEYLNKIHSNWLLLQGIVEKNKESLIASYKAYSYDKYTQTQLDDFIIGFTIKHKEELKGILSNSFNLKTDNFIKEIKKNLSSKTRRMKKIEDEKGKLSDEDILDNIECAFKSAFYMHFRYLYNNIDRLAINKPFATAIFYFIREYCYASMFRYNKSGGFNVPYGGISYNRKDFSKKIDYLMSKELKEYLGSTEIFNLDFEDFLNKHHPDKDDFIFLDPPYDTDFSSYAGNSFAQEDQKRLANYLYTTEANFMIVIKNTDFIHSLYNYKGFNIKTFDKQYLVSFQNRNNKNAKHLMITNY